MTNNIPKKKIVKNFSNKIQVDCDNIKESKANKANKLIFENSNKQVKLLDENIKEQNLQ